MYIRLTNLPEVLLSDVLESDQSEREGDQKGILDVNMNR